MASITSHAELDCSIRRDDFSTRLSMSEPNRYIQYLKSVRSICAPRLDSLLTKLFVIHISVGLRAVCKPKQVMLLKVEKLKPELFDLTTSD